MGHILSCNRCRPHSRLRDLRKIGADSVIPPAQVAGRERDVVLELLRTYLLAQVNAAQFSPVVKRTQELSDHLWQNALKPFETSYWRVQDEWTRILEEERRYDDSVKSLKRAEGDLAKAQKKKENEKDDTKKDIRGREVDARTKELQEAQFACSNTQKSLLSTKADSTRSALSRMMTAHEIYYESSVEGWNIQLSEIVEESEPVPESWQKDGSRKLNKLLRRMQKWILLEEALHKKRRYVQECFLLWIADEPDYEALKEFKDLGMFWEEKESYVEDTIVPEFVSVARKVVESFEEIWRQEIEHDKLMKSAETAEKAFKKVAEKKENASTKPDWEEKKDKIESDFSAARERQVVALQERDKNAKDLHEYKIQELRETLARLKKSMMDMYNDMLNGFIRPFKAKIEGTGEEAEGIVEEGETTSFEQGLSTSDVQWGDESAEKDEDDESESVKDLDEDIAENNEEEDTL